MNDSFPVIDRLIHLNHAAVGPWPRATAEVVKAFADENAQTGSLHYPRWEAKERTLREDLARLIGAAVDEIALIKNTSEGLSLVAHGLDWRDGDNVVGIRQEFPSNRFVWQSLSDQGVDFRQLDLAAASDDPEQALFDLCDARTRLVTVSAVQYADGFRMDLPRIGAFCRDRGILFCVDAIQQLGALPFDVRDIGCDFAVADGHKWLLAPEGLGVMFVRKAVQHRLRLLQYGWHMVEPLADYAQSDFRVLDSAQRFEAGSPNTLGIHALQASVALLLEQGMERIGAQVIDHTRYLIERLPELDGVTLLSDTRPQRLSGIVTFRPGRLDPKHLFKRLIGKRILCAPRGGGIRLSPHFYVPRAQLDEAIDIIADELARGGR
jgi:selenocysteine lyase/cysteine desulfurase